MRILMVIFSVFLTATSWAVSMVSIQGFVRERGTRNPLSEVNFYCFPASDPEKPIKVTTDSTGHFTIEVPEGKFKWVASGSNYNRLEKEDEQAARTAATPREFFLEKTSYLAYETTVYGQNEKRDDKTKTLDQSQFMTVPGANGDPVKAVQNLPGVNRASALSAQIIIEGSSPNDTRYDIDHQNVPIIFHFGGLFSVVMPEAIDHVDYLSAGFGPEFGQSIAGLVDLSVKDPKTDRVHGLAYMDLYNTGGLAEGPINDHSSFLIGLRQSYIELVLGAVAKNNANFNLVAAPDFRDTVLVYRNAFTPIDTFRVVTVGSMDSLAFLLKEPVGRGGSIRGTFSQETDFFRIIPEWTHKYNSDVIGRASVGIGKDWTSFNFGTNFFNSQSVALTPRMEIEDQLDPIWKSYLGIDSQLYWLSIDYQTPPGRSSLAGAAPSTASNQYFTNATSLYSRNVIHSPDSRWTYIPGVRLSYFNLTKQIMPEPRLALRYALDHGYTLRAAGGLYDEAPPTQDMDQNFGNPNLISQRAIHGSVGVEKDFRDGDVSGFTLSNDFFYKYQYNLVARSTGMASPSQPLFYDNSGYGNIFGLETLIKYKAKKMEGWLAYTLSRGTYGDSRTALALSQFDQTHILTMVGDVELESNWKFSLRVRFTTGNPFTPVIGGILDVDNDSYSSIPGATNSQRMGSFFQTDIRVDKKWIYDKWILTGYLDIENITNAKNVAQISYNYDFSQTAKVIGLPILPTLGIKAEF